MMPYKNIASIFAIAVLSLQAGCTQAAPAGGLAATEKIHACIEQAATAVNIPAPRIQQNTGLVEKFSETDNARAFIKISVDSYMADNPDRETDQVNFFANYTTQGIDGPIEIYRAKQISFDADTSYPYPPNETGHALYAHRDEIELGRNFTPTAQEETIEAWVYGAVEAMDQHFKTCMGFETDSPEMAAPDFPAFNTP